MKSHHSYVGLIVKILVVILISIFAIAAINRLVGSRNDRLENGSLRVIVMPSEELASLNAYYTSELDRNFNDNTNNDSDDEYEISLQEFATEFNGEIAIVGSSWSKTVPFTITDPSLPNSFVVDGLKPGNYSLSIAMKNAAVKTLSCGTEEGKISVRGAISCALYLTVQPQNVFADGGGFVQGFINVKKECIGGESTFSARVVASSGSINRPRILSCGDTTVFSGNFNARFTYDVIETINPQQKKNGWKEKSNDCRDIIISQNSSEKNCTIVNEKTKKTSNLIVTKKCSGLPLNPKGEFKFVIEGALGNYIYDESRISCGQTIEFKNAPIGKGFQGRIIETFMPPECRLDPRKNYECDSSVTNRFGPMEEGKDVNCTIYNECRKANGEWPSEFKGVSCGPIENIEGKTNRCSNYSICDGIFATKLICDNKDCICKKITGSCSRDDNGKCEGKCNDISEVCHKDSCVCERLADYNDGIKAESFTIPKR